MENDSFINTTWNIKMPWPQFLKNKFDLRGQRSFVNEVAHLIVKFIEKVGTDIYNCSRVTRAQSSQFDLRGQVDLGGQRSIFVNLDNHEESIPWNFCVDWISLTWVITLS